jgi:hypothetical protein
VSRIQDFSIGCWSLVTGTATTTNFVYVNLYMVVFEENISTQSLDFYLEGTKTESPSDEDPGLFGKKLNGTLKASCKRKAFQKVRIG